VIPHRIVLASVAGLVSALLLAACDSSTDNAGGTSPGSIASIAPVATAASESATSAPAGDGSGDSAGTTTTEVIAQAVSGTGDVVTDGKGMTLYRYDKDEPNPSKWTCSGACTKTWIPVIVQDFPQDSPQDSVRTTGVDKSLLGTVHRDGEPQLTLAGWPLYRYSGDTAAGQVNGQGQDGQWHAVTPAGGKSGASG
jgi:predicted lipoprotein with Yx(FWY)xxD motif